MKESAWISYSFDVKFEARARAGSPTRFQNHSNTVDARCRQSADHRNPHGAVRADVRVHQGGEGRQRAVTSMFKEKLAKNPKLVSALEKAGWKIEQRLAVRLLKAPPRTSVGR